MGKFSSVDFCPPSWRSSVLPSLHIHFSIPDISVCLFCVCVVLAHLQFIINELRTTLTHGHIYIYMRVMILPIFENYILTRLNCTKLLGSSRWTEEMPNRCEFRGNRVQYLFFGVSFLGVFPPKLCDLGHATPSVP